ncbi:prepilin-type N-terminal cleavage/methylation domain-containing protein [Pseudoalteromonas sp. MMG006]|uniref:PilW family protein n=1 Tax=unclassified Pseudoalteromonas TaxID=194690 RepID=UPI001B3707B8|nr:MULTISPECIES: prepilin-type N-terminal cleavage/methylation domain-containing protein [unclassified Pseudoalteromonas]MBQ4799239.1 prepilin-type N-terminal cleavage/methylation domain-containing protein [Pseudoalteromonas sp. MMG006]MBQ4858614.1 prepilin-type N-terminal cleavage/methylation domain-containing protein [Pseudoalteromonas sp. MMG007]
MRGLINKHKGFTLIELMVALASGMLLLGGVSLAYSSINSSTSTAKNLENALDVIRFTSKVFTRSLKQTNSVPIYTNNILSVAQEAGAYACTGLTVSAPFTEKYSLEGDSLFCDIGNGKVKILKGVNAISYVIDNNVVSVHVEPTSLPSQFNNSLVIDISLSQMVMNMAFQ